MSSLMSYFFTTDAIPVMINSPHILHWQLNCSKTCNYFGSLGGFQQNKLTFHDIKINSL
jgi:hypothetical protein